MDCIRVLIVDDHRLFRQGLSGLLRSEPGFEVLGEASSGEEALRLLQTLHPDVVLVDLAMPGISGSDLIAAVAQRPARPAIIVLTASEETGDVLGAIQAGAQGYVLKDVEADALFAAIRRVNAGGAAASDDILPRLLDIVRGIPPRRPADPLLTAREQEVAELLAQGADNGHIARRLFISENTVKTHVAHILAKLGLQSRAELNGTSGRGRIRD